MQAEVEHHGPTGGGPYNGRMLRRSGWGQFRLEPVRIESKPGVFPAIRHLSS